MLCGAGCRGVGHPRTGPAMEESLALLVRSPTQRHPDLRLRAAPAWTVRRLKAELRRLVPEAPVSARPLGPLHRPLLAAVGVLGVCVCVC